MAQINLLKQNNRSDNLTNVVATGIVRALLVVVLLLVGYYGWVYWQGSQTNKDILATEQDIQKNNTELSSLSGKDELYTRQAQLKEIGAIIAHHPYWSALMPALAHATLKSARYVSLRAQDDGTITLGVVVPDMRELDKFLQVFNLPEFYKNFSDVRVSSISNVQQGNVINYQFSVKFNYNTSLLSYQQALGQ